MSYSLPPEIRNNPHCKEYRHLHAGNPSPLYEDYCHFVREPHPDDVPGPNGTYYGEWKDVTVKDKAMAKLKNAEGEMLLLNMKIEKLNKEIKELKKETE